MTWSILSANLCGGDLVAQENRWMKSLNHDTRPMLLSAVTLYNVSSMIKLAYFIGQRNRPIFAWQTADFCGLFNLTLPLRWAGCYACPALRPYQFSPMRIPECNHEVTGKWLEAVDGCEALNKRLWSCKRL